MKSDHNNNKLPNPLRRKLEQSLSMGGALFCANIRAMAQPLYKLKILKRCIFGGALAGFAVLMTACDGGSGSPLPVTDSSTGMPAPTLTVTPQSVKTFHFTWADVSGETEYRLLENPDGASGYTQVATIAADATSHDLVVSLPKRTNARYRLQACNTSGCADSAAVSASGTLAAAIGYVKASNADVVASSGDVVGAAFGTSVALSTDGKTLAVGAPGEASNATGIGGNQRDNSAYASGAVYIYALSGSTWIQQAYIKASNAEAGDYFGWSLGLSADGNTLAVGAVSEGSTRIGGVPSGSGAVYVYIRSGSVWTQQAYVKASNTATHNDNFGLSLALSSDGNTLAAGTYREGSSATGIDIIDGIDDIQINSAAPTSGAVYVYTRSDGVWTQQAYVKASNTGAGDSFGWSLALSDNGNTLAVGAIGESSAATGVGGDQSDNTAPGSGAAYVYIRSGGVWTQQSYVKASNTGATDQFGVSLSLSGDGNTLAVGAAADHLSDYGEDSNTTGINGNQSDNSAPGSGAVYVYTRSAATWAQQAYVKASNTEDNDGFGWSLALSNDGNTLAVGALGEESNAVGLGGNQGDNRSRSSGATYVFTRSSSGGGGGWMQQAYVKASNTPPTELQGRDFFGWSLALSGDGNTLAVGATSESSNATGIGGNQSDNSSSSSGAVYLY